MINPVVFRERVKSLRLAMGLNQETLGKQLDISKISISDIERGHRLTSIENLAKMAVLFNVSADYLLGLTDDPRRH